MEIIKIICSCGLNEKLNENKIKWNEDETCDCPICYKKLSFSHKPKINSYSFWGE